MKRELNEAPFHPLTESQVSVPVRAEVAANPELSRARAIVEQLLNDNKIPVKAAKHHERLINQDEPSGSADYLLADIWVAGRRLTQEEEWALGTVIQDRAQSCAREMVALATSEPPDVVEAFKDQFYKCDPELGVGRRLFIERNARLAYDIAKKFAGRDRPLDDLVAEGMAGLVKAAEKFDPHRGIKFGTYATWWIRQAIIRALQDSSRTIRIPVHMGDRINALNSLLRTLEQEQQRSVLVSEERVVIRYAEEFLIQTPTGSKSRKRGTPTEQATREFQSRVQALLAATGHLTLRSLVADPTLNPKRSTSFNPVARGYERELTLLRKAWHEVETTVLAQEVAYPTSLETAVTEEGDTLLGDLIADEGLTEDEVVARDRAALLAQVLKNGVLNDQQRYVLGARFGLDGGRSQTLGEIGAEMNGISKERVRQIGAEALCKLANDPTCQRLFATLLGRDLETLPPDPVSPILRSHE